MKVYLWNEREYFCLEKRLIYWLAICNITIAPVDKLTNLSFV